MDPEAGRAEALADVGRVVAEVGREVDVEEEEEVAVGFFAPVMEEDEVLERMIGGIRV